LSPCPKYTPKSVPRQYFRSSLPHARASTFSLKESEGVAHYHRPGAPRKRKAANTLIDAAKTREIPLAASPALALDEVTFGRAPRLGRAPLFTARALD
jgi:hypothetical protein